MKRKTGFLICILTVCMICLSFCENTYAAAKKTSIKLNKSKAIIYTSGNRTVQLKATVKGASKKVTWKSSNKKVATVSPKGRVTAKKTGVVVITAKANGKIAKCNVTVKNNPQTSYNVVKGKYYTYRDDMYFYEIRFSKRTKNIYIGVWDKSGKGPSLEDFSFDFKKGKRTYIKTGCRSKELYEIKLLLYKDCIKIKIKRVDNTYALFDKWAVFKFAGYLQY